MLVGRHRAHGRPDRQRRAALRAQPAHPEAQARRARRVLPGPQVAREDARPLAHLLVQRPLPLGDRQGPRRGRHLRHRPPGPRRTRPQGLPRRRHRLHRRVRVGGQGPQPGDHEFFATKPPLLTVFAAGQYWVLHRFFHRNIDDAQVGGRRPDPARHQRPSPGPGPVAVLAAARGLRDDRLGPAVHVRRRLLRDLLADVHDHAQQPRPGRVLRDVRPVRPARAAAWAVRAAVLRRGPPVDGTSSPVRLLVAGLFAGLAACMDLPALAFAGASGSWSSSSRRGG